MTDDMAGKTNNPHTPAPGAGGNGEGAAVPPGGGRDRRCRWLAVALTASLAVNLFVLGLVVGGPLFRGAPPPDAPVLGDRALPTPRAIIRALGPERGRALLQEVRRQLDGMPERIREVRAARRAVAEAMRRDPYDPDAVRAAFARLRRAHSEVAEALQEPLVAALGRLSAQERAQLAALFTRPSRRPFPRPARHGPPPDDPAAPGR